MNTLKDADEGRARPPVWPVYLAAVMVGVVGLSFASLGIWFGLANEDNGVAALGVTYALLGALGVVVARALSQLRPWAWWCVVASIFVLGWSLLLWLFIMVVFRYPRGGDALLDLSFWVIVAVPLLWALVTRRRLFFPPKEEGKE